MLGAKKGERLTLVHQGRVVARGRADRFGSRIFRALPAGSYKVRGHRLRVLGQQSNPPRSLFKRTKLKAGLNYVKVRDGVELAMTVRLPAGKTLADGPFPTLVEYSGYQTAAPHDLLASIVASLTGGGDQARSARARELDGGRRADRAAAQLRGRQRADARLGLLGRRLRPVRPADDVRRLRRRRDRRGAELGQGREGRHGRHLVLRHHAALHGGHAAAAPRGDHADVGHRRPLHGDRLPRWDRELRLRQDMGEGAHGRREARARAAASRGRRRW